MEHDSPLFAAHSQGGANHFGEAGGNREIQKQTFFNKTSGEGVAAESLVVQSAEVPSAPV